MSLTAYAFEVIFDVTPMFELLTTDVFAEWFSAIDDAAAEDVAATVDVIAQLGANTEAPGSSEWLLWYEHPSMSGRARSVPPEHRERFEAGVRAANQWGAFLGYVRRALKHLESAQFVERVGHLTPDDAAKVSDAIRRIRAALKSRQLAMSQLVVRLHQPPEGPAFQRLIDLTDVRHWYFAALAAAGFTVEDVPAHSPALREIALRTRGPGLRLLYGIDAPRARGLVVFGEWLDRSFYGDSVRRAEQLWQQFLGGTLAQTRPSAPR
jgi:hypothetical protein